MVARVTTCLGRCVSTIQRRLSWKPPLTVLVGAGGSVELGAPSTSNVTPQVFSAIAAKAMSDAAGVPVASLAALFEQTLRTHYGPSLNFEHVLHALEAMDGFFWAWRAPQIPHAHRLVEAMICPQPTLATAPLFQHGFLWSAQRAFFEEIHDAFAVASKNVKAHRDWSVYEHFWKTLDAEFELSVITLNYDSFIDQALDATGLDQGFVPVDREFAWRFSRPTLRRERALMHLHGSIHFGERASDVGDLNRFAFEDAWEDLFFYPSTDDAKRSRTIRSAHDSQAGRKTTKGPFITGLNKPDKLMVEPYDAYYQRFAQQVLSTPRLLVIGYGFGDLHVNAIIDRMTKYHGARRRIASITFANDLCGWGHERLAESRMVMRWAEEQAPFDRIVVGDPWISENQRVRVYHHGFLDAARTATSEVVRFFQR